MLTKRMPFELSEYRQRLEKCQEMMREKGLDLLLVHTPENIFYLCGYHSAGYYMYNCLVVHAALRRGRQRTDLLLAR